MNEREKLIGLLMSAPTDIEGNRGVGAIADYLLEHGVIVPPVKRGEWHKWENTMNSKTLGVFCSICHSCSDNMTDFCPNCGAKVEIVR